MRYHRRLIHARHLTMICTALLLFCMVPVQDTHGLPKRDDTNIPTACTEQRSVFVQLALDGIHLDNRVVRNRSITVDGTTAKIFELPRSCEAVLYPVPQGEWNWNLARRPIGSNAALTGTGDLTATLTPDVDGAYAVRLTLCPGGCNVNGKPVAQEQFTFELEAVERLALPPGTEPVLPAQMSTNPASIPDAKERCLNGGGVVDPQWVTVEEWNGPADYERLEGSVVKSRVSRKDNFLNHDSQDHNAYVEPDPPDRRLLRPDQDEMEVEWERNHFPEPFRPTPGDRVSVFGYWILDCGHDEKSEIHPPIGLITHRARPVQIPSDQDFPLPNNDDVTPIIMAPIGDNVWVPGIVSDVWFNSDAGEVTRNCSDTGLHEPGHFEVINGTPASITGDCIQAPNPLNRVFQFNIYLPERPALQFSRDVPLYVEVFDHPYGFAVGPDPTVQLIDGATPYLRVTLDLRGFTGRRYARRIKAGWVLGEPTNWGLQRWKLRLRALDVHYDGDNDWAGRGDGDWRFWLNLNNTLSEWTKLYDCSGCVTGRITFGGRPWQTGEPNEVSADRSLGSDYVLFPDQRLWVHSSGFESDWVVDDDTGSVNDLHSQRAIEQAVAATGTFRRTSRSFCREQYFADLATTSGCAEYSLEYEIVPGPAIPPASLSAAGQRLLNQYSIGPTGNDDARCLPCVNAEAEWYPMETTLVSGQEPVDLPDTMLFRMQPNPEPNAMTDISTAQLRTTIATTRISRPEKLDHFMKAMRSEFEAAVQGPEANEAILGMRVFKQSVPPDLWKQYFGGLMLYTAYLPEIQR